MISLVLMDASDTLLASGKGVRWPRHDGVHPRVQAGGGGAVGDKRAPPDADRRRARHPALAAAALAEVDPRPWLEADDPAGRHHACPAVASAGGPSPADLASENAWLQRELERARAERDILEKAISRRNSGGYGGWVFGIGTPHAKAGECPLSRGNPWSDGAMVEACCQAWNGLANEHGRIRSHTSYPWPPCVTS